MISLHSLEEDYNQTKLNLYNLNASINKSRVNTFSRKPREPIENKSFTEDKLEGVPFKSSNRNFQDHFQSQQARVLVPRQKKKDKNCDGGDDDVFEDDDERIIDELENKPMLSSSVVAITKPEKTKEEILKLHSKDQSVLKRNKRMFGHLLDTLNQFQVEAKLNKEKVSCREEIEKKVEERDKRERDAVLVERKRLFDERNRTRNRIQKLELKMPLLKYHENWKAHKMHLQNFIQTLSEPQIFYLPKIMNEDSNLKMTSSKERILEKINKKEEELMTFFEKMESLSHQREINKFMNASTQFNFNSFDKNVSYVPAVAHMTDEVKIKKERSSDETSNDVSIANIAIQSNRNILNSHQKESNFFPFPKINIKTEAPDTTPSEQEITCPPRLGEDNNEDCCIDIASNINLDDIELISSSIPY